jgi:hypothetical protein
MMLTNVIYSFIVMATVITIVNYDCTVIMIVNYNPKTFIVQATGQCLHLVNLIGPKVRVFLNKQQITFCMNL